MSVLLDLLSEVFWELATLVAPLWLAAVIGLLISWAWRPRWDAAVVTNQQLGVAKAPAPLSPQAVPSAEKLTVVPRAATKEMVALSAPSEEDKELAVNTTDLMHLRRVVEEKDGRPAWIHMMDRSLPAFRYQAWRRDMENGPPQYRSSTIFEDASPDVVRDFFWDDEFRMKNTWDDMLQECTETGTMVVRWVRKFPFFCSDREYIIGRRIWASGKTYYCVTKVVPEKDTFRYLGSMLQKDGDIDADVIHRIKAG